MTAVLILQNDREAPPDLLDEVQEASGLPARVVALDEGEPLPELSTSAGPWLGIVSLGGVMGAYEEDRHPWLAAEKRLLAQAVRAQVPVLGICLGCQLLADALCGRAYLAPSPEIGYPEVRLTPAGELDPLLRALRNPVGNWHQDTWDLPPGATLLAVSDAYPQAFRLGSGVGVQFHPEASSPLFESWVRSADRSKLLERGIDPDELVGEGRRLAADIADAGRALLAVWVHQLREQPALR